MPTDNSTIALSKAVRRDVTSMLISSNDIRYLIIVDSTDATFAVAATDDVVVVAECRCIRIGKVSNVI